MKFLIAITTRKARISQLENCADYCVSKEGTVIIRCPVDGTLAYLPPENRILSCEPLTVEGPFRFPCETFHAFTVRDGKIQSSVYAGDERLKIAGFDK